MANCNHVPAPPSSHVTKVWMRINLPAKQTLFAQYFHDSLLALLVRLNPTLGEGAASGGHEQARAQAKSLCKPFTPTGIGNLGMFGTRLACGHCQPSSLFAIRHKSATSVLPAVVSAKLSSVSRNFMRKRLEKEAPLRRAVRTRTERASMTFCDVGECSSYHYRRQTPIHKACGA